MEYSKTNSIYELKIKKTSPFRELVFFNLFVKSVPEQSNHA